MKYRKKIEKQLNKLPEDIQDVFDRVLERLELYGPCPEGWNVKKLAPYTYRLRLGYRYRLLYKVENDKLIIELIYIGHRKNAYRKSF